MCAKTYTFEVVKLVKGKCVVEKTFAYTSELPEDKVGFVVADLLDVNPSQLRLKKDTDCHEVNKGKVNGRVGARAKVYEWINKNFYILDLKLTDFPVLPGGISFVDKNGQKMIVFYDMLNERVLYAIGDMPDIYDGNTKHKISLLGDSHV